jgi:hypothetical protein
MALDEVMPYVSKDHDDGSQVRVSKLMKLFFIVVFVIRTNVRMLE